MAHRHLHRHLHHKLLKLRQERYEVLQAPAQPVHAPRRDEIELTLNGSLEQRVETAGA